MRLACVVLLSVSAIAQSDPFSVIQKHIAAGRYSEAVAELNRSPGNTLTWHLLASKAFDGAGDPTRAVQEAEAALAIDPRSEAAHLQLGQIFLARNTPAAAADIFTEALVQLPQSLLLRLGRGLALKDLQRYEEAEADLKQCLSSRPDFPVAFDTLATVYLHTKRYGELERLARDYRSKFPREYRAAYYIAAALEGAKSDSPEVQPLLQESIAMNAGFSAAHALLGKVRLQNGDAAGAVTPLETALRLRPDYTPAALHLAQAYQKTGRKADAERAYNLVKVLKDQELAPKPSLRYHRGTR